MSALELISQVEVAGITLRVVGDKLRVKAELGIITPEIKAQLTANKTEIMQALSAVAKSRPETRVYQVVVHTAGEPKGMTVIDPSGDGLEAFTRSCYGRFGKARVISIEPKQRYGG